MVLAVLSKINDSVLCAKTELFHDTFPIKNDDRLFNKASFPAPNK